MTARGNLELFPFPEFLKVLADLGKSGKLTLSRYEERGVVILRRGKIIHAASSSIRETLGGLLVGQKLITEDQLMEGLEVQRNAEAELRLGNILVDRGFLSQEDLEHVITEQTRRVILELLQWQFGFFEFGPFAIEDHGEIETEVSELLLSHGLSAETVILAAAVGLAEDVPEDTRAERERISEASADGPPPASAGADAEEPPRDAMSESPTVPLRSRATDAPNVAPPEDIASPREVGPETAMEGATSESLASPADAAGSESPTGWEPESFTGQSLGGQSLGGQSLKGLEQAASAEVPTLETSDLLGASAEVELAASTGETDDTLATPPSATAREPLTVEALESLVTSHRTETPRATTDGAAERLVAPFEPRAVETPTDESSTDAVALESATFELPTLEPPEPDAPALGSSALESPALESPAAESPAAESPAVESPAVESPAVESPAVGSPTVESPAVESPAVESPAVGSPTIELPVAGETESIAPPFEGVAADLPTDKASGGLVSPPDAGTPEPATQETRESPDPSRAAVTAEPPTGSRREDLASLRDLMLEMRSPEFTGELTTKVMDYASRLFRRSVLFSLQGGYFSGMASFGVGLSDSAAEAVRRMRIPVGDPSVLADVAALHGTYQGPLPDEEWNRILVEHLGGAVPPEVAAVPLVVNSRVVLVLYGDTVPDNDPIDSLTELELLMLQVGLAMEKGLLEKGSRAKQDATAKERPGLRSEDLRLLVDADPEPTLVVDSEGAILYANRSMGATVQSTVVELLGGDVCTLVHPEDAADLREILREIQEGGAPGGSSVRFRRPDGLWRAFYLLPSTIGGQSEARCVMLRAATGSETRQRHDPLTGLLHREALVERVAKTLKRSKQEDEATFAVMLLDIDRFKLVNAGFGWAGGNELLGAVGNRLTEHLRPSDVVARLGGDQFCVLLDRLRARRDARMVGERIIDFMDQPFRIAGQEVFVSVSIGGALSHPDCKDADEIIGEAEVAVLAAKKEHGSSLRVRDSKPGGQFRASARLQLEHDLRRAIEYGEFAPYYQPILSLETGAITAFELLVRWDHPDRGLLQPAEFLPVAEETGLIVPISKVLLRNGCLQLRRWQDRFMPDPPLSIGMNFTVAHLERSEVMNTVQASMDRSGIDGRQLGVEITESMMMQQRDKVVQILTVLKELDVRVYIDDFGMEYSSLSYLHELPVDVIKVDRSFVGRLGTDEGSEVIVRAIVDLAHDLGKTVVAEGIENPEQLRVMKGLGCELGQGFLFAQPQSAERTEQLLSSEAPWTALF